MELSKNLKSRVITGLIKDIPGFMSMEGVRTLTTDPEKAVFGFEDAAECEQIILTDQNQKDLKDKFDSTSLNDLFPNARLGAELEIVKETNRTKYDEFTDKLFELQALASEIDNEVGEDLNFLLDEIKQNANPDAIDAVKNLGVGIVDIENGKIASK
ncbi:MAG: hypothetical protein IJ772_04575 [Bacilli bacterium]|nr:hypothetical protein [Bacilli bacterium]